MTAQPAAPQDVVVTDKVIDALLEYMEKSRAVYRNRMIAMLHDYRRTRAALKALDRRAPGERKGELAKLREALEEMTEIAEGFAFREHEYAAIKKAHALLAETAGDE